MLVQGSTIRSPTWFTFSQRSSCSLQYRTPIPKSYGWTLVRSLLHNGCASRSEHAIQNLATVHELTSRQTLNLLLTEAYEDSPNDCYFLVLIRDSEAVYGYKDVTHPPVVEGISNSPFKGKSQTECYHILKTMCEEKGSDLNYGYFLIIDERSLEDKTVLICCSWPEDQDESFLTVRVRFVRANTITMCLSIGHTGWDEVEESELLKHGVKQSQESSDSIQRYLQDDSSEQRRANVAVFRLSIADAHSLESHFCGRPIPKDSRSGDYLSLKVT